jgi:acyl-[acyl-carrier-protein]-phospholipid O-acyltransferase / long-chain-fatty-acid--[acyl-carrier-protein] ligase
MLHHSVVGHHFDMKDPIAPKCNPLRSIWIISIVLYSIKKILAMLYFGFMVGQEKTGDLSAPKNLRGFWALIITQFQGAFNDNAYKMLLTLFGTDLAVQLGQNKETLTGIIFAVFTLPFLLFSMHGGYFADRYSKRTVTIATKIAEIIIMLLGAIAFLSSNWFFGYRTLAGMPFYFWFSVSILFFTGAQAAYFGPSKYGIIPELISEKRISWANGILELTTFVAIILGTFIGAVLMQLFKPQLQNGMYILACLSIVGVVSSLFITRVPAAAPDKSFKLNLFGDLVGKIKLARKDKVLWLAILGNSYFWFIASVIYMNIMIYGPDVLHLDDVQRSYLLISLAIGIGGGSYAAGYLSGNKIEYGLIPLGAIGISLFSLDLFRTGISFYHVLISLLLVGFGGGFFIVPISAMIQFRPEPTDKGGVQGISYFLANVGTFLAAGFYIVVTKYLHFAPREVFLCGAILTLSVTSYATWLVPDSLLRLVLWMLTHTFYRIKIVGRDNIPERGGALFVTNHMSLTDALFLIASTDRPIRFVMYSGIYNMRFIHPLAKILRCIPLAAEDGARALIQSLREATNGIKQGDVVCIFAEGQITRTGQMLPFRRGFQRIMKGVEEPIIPIHLDRVWGSIFSFEKGKFIWKWPHRIPYPITVSFGKPLPANTPVQEVRRYVQELATDAFTYRRKDMRPLHLAFIEEARRHRRRFSMADGLNTKVTNNEVLIRSIILAQKLTSLPTPLLAKERGERGEVEMVGLLMPPSVSGACLNIAALLCGKIPVNLNYTASQDSVQSSVDQCKIKTVVTARAFMEKIKITAPGNVIYLEDLVPQITSLDKFTALLKAWFYPITWIEKSLNSKKKWQLDDMATIIFSSGSTGDPKGVMLSHYNIYSNLEGVAQALAVDKHDRIMGVLPFFHSFGFTGTLWFPLIKGFGAVYHPNPMDARVIGPLCEKYKVTLLVATPTFLQAYIRRVEPGQFGSLRFILVGAEKLPDRIAFAFEDKFGIRPYEAYGTTECSPAVTINTISFRGAGFYQVGGKRGRIGHPLPGIAVRIVDPDSLQPLPIGQQGLLLIKGPNVMLGYLNKPEKTAEVLKDGWYVTGDIATVDEDGFLTITDRLSRFAKIGGEMVPLIKVEETLHELIGLTQQSLVVTAVPDERKGEKLIVLHILDDTQLEQIKTKLPSSGLPNLWIPRPDAFRKIDSIPILGTGKLDLRQIKQIALSF